MEQAPTVAPLRRRVAALVDDAGVVTGRLTASDGRDACPHWCPDGSRIAFSSDRTGDSELYVMDADGSGQRQLTTDGGNTCPDWSPDGSRLV